MPQLKKANANAKSPIKPLQGVATRTTRSAGKLKTVATKENASLVKDIPELVAVKTSAKKIPIPAKPSTPETTALKHANVNTNTRTVVVSFEACRSCHRFAKRANEIFAELEEKLPNNAPVKLELSINGPNADGTDLKVRRGAFEVSVYEKTAGPDGRRELWTGLKRGPPRAKKYPETENVLADILKMFEC